MDSALGIYIHLPFCKKKCSYCDFYSLPAQTDTEAQKKLYQKALLRHLELLAPSAQGYQVDSLYFGGGTPSFYGVPLVLELKQTVERLFTLDKKAEITMEANPESLDKQSLLLLQEGGIHRLSMGLQSASDQELTAVGRIHSHQDSRQVVELCQSLEWQNLSLDLMYGLPQQSTESWRATLEEAIALHPQHLSCYGLKLEEDTPLYQAVQSGKLRSQLPSQDSQAQRYLWTVQRLEEAGYHQYEISNFAQRGYESRHNLGYWQGKPYLGVGASASSDFQDHRFTCLPSLEDYCRGILEEGKAPLSHRDKMEPEDRFAEYLMLRLRTREGISAQGYEAFALGGFAPVEQRLERYAQEGWAQLKEGGWSFTPEGFLRSNLLLVELLELQEASLP